jgi:chromosome segregation ATPase
MINNNQLQTLQREAERLRSEINMLETEKMEAMSQIFRLKRMIPELEETLAQKRAEMAYMNQESRKFCAAESSIKDLSTITPISCILLHSQSRIPIRTLME